MLPDLFFAWFSSFVRGQTNLCINNYGHWFSSHLFIQYYIEWLCVTLCVEWHYFNLFVVSAVNCIGTAFELLYIHIHSELTNKTTTYTINCIFPGIKWWINAISIIIRVFFPLFSALLNEICKMGVESEIKDSSSVTICFAPDIFT